MTKLRHITVEQVFTITTFSFMQFASSIFKLDFQSRSRETHKILRKSLLKIRLPVLSAAYGIHQSSWNQISRTMCTAIIISYFLLRRFKNIFWMCDVWCVVRESWFGSQTYWIQCNYLTFKAIRPNKLDGFGNS